MRSLLDVHPDVKCGPETKFSLDLINFFDEYKQKGSFQIDDNLIQKAVGLSVFYFHMANVQQTKYICNKEPLNIKKIDFYKNTFANSKFIYILRDGREASYAILKNMKYKKTFKKLYQILNRWNKWNRLYYPLCVKAGKEHCKLVRYEDLVQKPVQVMQEVVNFLGISWTDKFLEHHKYIGTDIKIAKGEQSLYGIKNEINNKSLGNWIGNVENYDANKVNENIDMLKFFGYIK
jgi:hypothetical protein